MLSARDHLLGIPELLEAILLHLGHVAPPNELLRAQLISRRVHTAIASSPRIQQLLFLRAEPADNPKPWRANPLLRDLFLPWFVGPLRERWTMPDYDSFQMMDWTSTNRDAFLRAEASWRKMLVFQPPPKQLSVVRFCNGQGGDFIDEATVSFADSASGGVTMGLIYDLSESFVRENPVSQFGISLKTSATGPPRIALHLIYTSQCCPSSPSSPRFMSQGAKSQCEIDMLEWQLEKEVVEEGSLEWGTRSSIDWETDFSVGRGVLNLWEWEEWKRKRAPISDLVSDVR
ncbi:uncharacterized protein K460DRAFT_366434 [Cucurbitaria berberidis CBS 394.84]|uniref:F-box domain-containing protein n=1 Tax=Cucurbitaria berberidis CBS 394.84 TaxID=1168544 RepID=A0A9P4L8V0_9PLEO|nr:uncharacterized protein K460DRAFT_366434 [Cucurbitaria berberidis CBS 394.84]KAF1845569.1 hypothetical protein K460DRAFT_366434 [Cucurbitaria berberidis CBS 394.84]